MPLTNQERIAEARVAIFENAVELLRDARLLLAHDRAARAYALAHLALEEIAKLPMLLRCAVEGHLGKSVDFKKLGKRLRSHKEKVDVIHSMDYFHSEVRFDDSDVRTYQNRLRQTSALLSLKNGCFYAEEVDGRYRRPSEVVSEELAGAMLRFVEVRLEYLESSERATRDNMSELLEGSYTAMLLQTFDLLGGSSDAMRDAAVEQWLHETARMRSSSGPGK